MGRARGRNVGAAAERRGNVGRRKWWTDERIEVALRDALAGRTEWPTSHELIELVGSGLEDAARKGRGSAYWADRLGLRVPPERDRTVLSSDEAVQQAVAVIAELGRLPRSAQLSELGHTKLAMRVKAAGGTVAFCELHGLPNPRGRGRRLPPDGGTSEAPPTTTT